MKNLTQTISITVSALLLSSCSNFPEKGQGGMAEHNQYEQEFSSGNVRTLDELMKHEGAYPVEPDRELRVEHGLRFDLELLQRHLDSLILQGAELCFPATVVQAKIREKRIVRELKGKLIYDASNDIIVQRTLLGRLEKQLNYVKNHNVCELPTTIQPITQKKPGELAQQIHELLNSDNQFSVNSSEINPKYVLRLAKAAELLKMVANYKLKITGHTDNTGTDELNLKLSLDRAKQVKRYLQILGINQNRMEVDAIGPNAPLFDGQESHVRLVNRRVSIDIIEIHPSSILIDEGK